MFKSVLFISLFPSESVAQSLSTGQVCQRSLDRAQSVLRTFYQASPSEMSVANVGDFHPLKRKHNLKITKIRGFPSFEKRKHNCEFNAACNSSVELRGAAVLSPKQRRQRVGRT
jgi:hypothetical protein